LIVTSEWPTYANPHWVPFLVQQIEALRNAGVVVDVFHFRGAGKPANYLKNWQRLRRDNDFLQYDLIHAHFGQSGLLCFPKPLPLVVTFHGSDLQGIVNPDGTYASSGRFLRQVSRFVAWFADQSIIVSKHLISYLPKHISPHIIPGGIDMQRFQPADPFVARQQLGLPMDQFLVLFPANPDNPIKRYSLARQALEILKNSQNAELVVLTGISHDKVPVYMNACDALLVTSLHEGSPTVVKEALACDLPVVSVDVGDVRSLISDLPGCALCEEDTPEVIAAALERILGNPTRPQLRQAVSHLDQSLVAERIIHLYRMVLSS
jgi:glycosyltransferase involved in cell wall biosynthesis